MLLTHSSLNTQTSNAYTIYFHILSTFSPVKLGTTSRRSIFRSREFGSSGFRYFIFNRILDVCSTIVPVNRSFLYRMRACLDSGAWNVGSSDVVWRIPRLNWGRRRKSIGSTGNARLPEPLSSLPFSVCIRTLPFLHNSLGLFFLSIVFYSISLNC